MNDPVQGELLQAQIGKLQESITTLIHIMYRGIEEQLTPSQLAVGEYAVLAVCLGGEPITISGIQEHVPLDSGRISRIVSTLEDRNLVQKIRPKTDRRVVRIRMTEEGRIFASELLDKVRSFYVDITSRVGDDELANLIMFIEKMAANAEVARQRMD